MDDANVSRRGPQVPGEKSDVDFRVLFENIPGLYLVLRPDLIIVAVSDAYLRATMTRRDDILGRGVFDVFPDNPGDPTATGVSNLRRSLLRVLDGKVSDAMAVQKYDIRRPESEGGGFEERFWSPFNSPVLAADGTLAYIIHRVEDVTEFVRLRHEGISKSKITEELEQRAGRMESEIFLRAQQVQETNRKLEIAHRELASLHEKTMELDRLKLEVVSKRSEDDRRASEERYRQLFEVNPHPMWVYDLENLTCLAVNDAAIAQYGYSRDEFLGLKVQAIQPSEELDALARTGERSVASQHLGKGGRVMEVEVTFHELTFEGRPARLVAATDVAGKRKVEAQLLRTQRMESIGTLAGGVAHDLNNVLSPIMMSVELLAGRLHDESSRSILDTLQAGTERAASIVRQLLTFARGAEGERVNIRLEHLLLGIEKIVMQTFPKSIRLKIDMPRNLWMITGDATQLDQVLLNLCVNARDAMPVGGLLSIAVENAILDEQYAKSNLEAQPGLYVVFSVSDSGFGIPPGNLDKIFEPFFTTKEVGKGTGLGLSTVRAIVKSHGGFIKVYSEVGSGTRFRVYLPAKQSVESGGAAAQRASLPLGNGELILVVDDEAGVRDITRVTLESSNYRVITAMNGAEAIAHYARRNEEISVILLDMMMPILDGPTAIRAIEAINPNVKIIAASGLIDGVRGAPSSSETSGSVRAFLAKPFTAAKLLNTLHRVLNPEP